MATGLLNRIIILLVLMALIVPVLAAGKSFNIPVYMQTSAGIEKVSYEEIRDLLFYREFEIQKVQGYVPDEKCSLRAEGGSLKVFGLVFDSKNSLSFNIPLKNSFGQGSLTAQKDRKRFSLDFEVLDILKTDSKHLIFEAAGIGKLNTQELGLKRIIVDFDKLNNRVSITGDNNLSIDNMQVSFIEWCMGGEIEYYLIVDKGGLKKPRTLEEIKKILDEHPELVEMYENLRNLDVSQIPVIPEFGGITAALTLVGAVGVFFLIKKSI